MNSNCMTDVKLLERKISLVHFLYLRLQLMTHFSTVFQCLTLCFQKCLLGNDLGQKKLHVVGHRVLVVRR